MNLGEVPSILKLEVINFKFRINQQIFPPFFIILTAGTYLYAFAEQFVEMFEYIY